MFPIPPPRSRHIRHELEDTNLFHDVASSHPCIPGCLEMSGSLVFPCSHSTYPYPNIPQPLSSLEDPIVAVMREGQAHWIRRPTFSLVASRAALHVESGPQARSSVLNISWRPIAATKCSKISVVSWFPDVSSNYADAGPLHIFATF